MECEIHIHEIHAFFIQIHIHEYEQYDYELPWAVWIPGSGVVTGPQREKKRLLMWASSFEMKNTLKALTTWSKGFSTSFAIICACYIFWVFWRLKLHFSLSIVFSWFTLVFCHSDNPGWWKNFKSLLIARRRLLGKFWIFQFLTFANLGVTFVLR